MSKLPAVPQAPALLVEPTPIEQSHIDQALEASETAISAIDTLLNISMWTLGILAVILALIGIVGWSVIRAACLNTAKQIANDKIDRYIASEDFNSILKERVDRAVKANWQNHLMKRLEEAVRDEANDPAPFPEKDHGNDDNPG